MMKRVSRCLLAAAMLACSAAAQSPAPDPVPGPDARLDWWRQARVGLMIDWSLAAGADPALLQAKAYSADAWMRRARDVGAKYVIVAAKASNGFSLYRSAHTDYDVVDATPLRRDVLGELGDAARAQGLRFGWAYSIADRHRAVPITDPVAVRDYVKFVEAQTRELLTRYGDVDVCRFEHLDPTRWDDAAGRRLLDLCRARRPDALVSGPLGTSPYRPAVDLRAIEYGRDQALPAGAATPTGAWEARISTGPALHLVRALVDVASRGGNLLVEVFPDADGRIPRRATDELDALGAWLRVNGESIYGTRASPFSTLAFGWCTVKTDAIYLHVLNWPRSNVVWLPGLRNHIVAARVLGAPDVPVEATRSPIGCYLHLETERPDLLLPVIKLTIKGEAEVRLSREAGR